MALVSPGSFIYFALVRENADKRTSGRHRRAHLHVIITNKGSVLEIEHNHNDKELYNLEIMAVLEKDQAPFNFDS